MYVSATLTLSQLPLSPTPCPQFHSLCLCLYSCPATRFISIIFFRVHIYALAYSICFSLSDLFHSAWHTVSPPTSPQITQFCFFLWLSNIPLYVCTTSSLSHSSVDGHLGCFHVLAIVNRAAMNIVVHDSFWIMVFSGYMPSSGIAGSYGSSVFSFLNILVSYFIPSSLYLLIPFHYHLPPHSPWLIFFLRVKGSKALKM